MVYKSRKRLRSKCAFGADGAVMAAATLAAAAMNTAATIKASKEQATAMRANADAQAKAQTAAAKTQSDALAQQSENNNKNVEEQINAQKELQESQNDIMKEMNLNLAMQAGQQNAQERAEQAKIVVKYGGSLRGKRLAGGITLQDNNYLVPIGQGVSLLRGGSPSHPQDQTHSNSHKNSISGRYNKGSYLKVNNKKIEAEAGGNKTTGEGIDPVDGFVFTQRPFIPQPDGSIVSAVDELLMGKPKQEVKFDQEYFKALYGLKNPNENKAMYGRKYKRNGGHCRPKAYTGYSPYTIGDYKSDYYNNQFDDGWDDPYNNILKGLNNPTNPVEPGKKGSWWSRQSPATQNALISGGINLGGHLITSLGNGIASGYMQRANRYANDVLTNARNQTKDTYIDAYKKMHGIDTNGLIKEDDFKATHAIANVRAGRFNINPQLVQVERDSARQLKSIRGSVNSALARQRLMSDIATRSQDARDKLYGEQANQIEKINQNNIAQLNEVAMKNAELDTRSKTNLSALKVDVAKYNNDIENTKIQGIADATADALMGNAQGSAQTRINNAGLRANFATNTLGGFGNILANAGKTYYDTDMSYRNMQNQYQIAAATSSNPNIMGSIAMQNPNNYDNQTLKLIYDLTTNDNVRKRLAGELSRRNVSLG